MKKNIFFGVVLFSLLFTGCTVQPKEEGTKIDKSLYIFQLPTKTTFFQYEQYTSEGMVVIDSKAGNKITDYVTSIQEGEVLNTLGDIRVNVSLEGYNPTSYAISVLEAPTKELEIATYPKVEYEYGDYFSMSGIVVKCGDEIIVDYSFDTFTIGEQLLTPGTYEITISKEGYSSVSYTVVVKKKIQLSVSTLPNLEYETGDAFSSSGLVVVNQNNQVITDYTLSIEEGSILKYEGDINVIISKDGYDDISFTIHVKKSEEIVEKSRDLRIYYINDTHGSFIRQIDGNSYEAGMSYISKYLKTQTKDDRENCLILSGGDMFQGSLESNETKGDIMVDAMNEIGFDAMVVGNHEFDWGESNLIKFANNVDCGLISSNIFYKSNNERPAYIKPYKIIERGDLKIGIIGAATYNMGSSITGSISNSFKFPDPVSYVKQYSDELRLSHNCDIIITLFHDEGFDGYEGEPTKFQELTTVSPSSNSKYTDVMFFAHDHMRKSGTYNGVPYLEAGCNGRNIGEMTLSLKGTATYDIDDCTYSVEYAYDICQSSDPAVSSLTNKYSEQIGNPNEIIYTFKNSYDSDSFTDVACRAMHWYVNNHLDEFDDTHVYFSSHNTGGVRANVYAGAMTRRKFVKVFPFDNELCIQTCTSTHISNAKKNSYYAYYEEDSIVYDSNGYTYAVSITYITESSYAKAYQKSFVKYETTAKQALIAYLKSAEGIAAKW